MTLLLLLLTAVSSRAQSFDAQIRVTSLTPPRIKIEGVRSERTQVWSFRNAYAGMLGLGERIDKLSLKDAHGADVPVRRLAAGEYQAARAATAFSYEMRLEPPAINSDASHVSWLTSERGVLMLGDLLPLSAESEKGSAKLRLALPNNWRAASLGEKAADGTYEIAETDEAIFFVGTDWREQNGHARSMSFKLISAGSWAFTDEDVIEVISAILKEHQEMTGGAAQKRAVVIVSPFPQQADAQSWSAETRGATVVFLSGRWPSKTAGLAQLSVPLVHELFHLWLPNGLNLSGDYDWFYEGFTLYQATRVATRLGYLTFQDYLNALGRAYDIYKAGDGEHLSLLEASRRRWTGATSVVYSKGMLVAALYDLNVKLRTGGKRSLDDVYRELFREHQTTNEKRDGNRVVIEALNKIAGTQNLTELYVRRSDSIELSESLAPFGLQVEKFGARTHLSVSNSLTHAQRDLLREIGYNERAGLPGHKPR